MKNHIPTIVPGLATVLHTHEVPLRRSDLEARELTAGLVRCGFDRCSPSYLLARSPLERSLRTVYAWGEPGAVGGLRAHDLLVAPRPFARVVLRGLVAAVDGAPPPDGPSRSSLAALLARIASLLLVASNEDPSTLSDEELRKRVETFDDNEDALRQARSPYDQEHLRRKLAGRPALSSKGGAL